MFSWILSAKQRWDLAERSERCANVLKVAGLNPTGGSESTFCSDLLSTARGSRT
jgi:hypothetical protein